MNERAVEFFRCALDNTTVIESFDRDQPEEKRKSILINKIIYTRPLQLIQVRQVFAILHALLIVACAQQTFKAITYLPDLQTLNKGIDIGRLTNEPSITDVEVAGYPNQPAWVVVAFDLEVDGRTTNIRSQLSHPVDYFDNAAAEYVRRSTYQPYLQEGEPVKIKNIRTLVIFNDLRDAPVKTVEDVNAQRTSAPVDIPKNTYEQ